MPAAETPIQPVLLVLTGPTGVGKTELSLRLAEHFGCPIVSADSRQIFREIPVGTAAPTAAEQARVKHYFVGTKSVAEDYNAGQYERDALTLLDTLFQTHRIVVLTGGSMMYIDAVCNGFDDIPSVPADLREQVKSEYQAKGLVWLQSEVQRLDPAYWAEVDRQNPQRLLHCVEICRTAGKPFSSFRSRTYAARPFRIVKVGLTRPREELYMRINLRVEQMMAQGLLEEARSVYPFRHRNSLQTVGYRELFAYMDGQYTLPKAVEMIQQNSRHYAKRQMTWFNRDTTIHWLNADLDYETQLHTIIDWLCADGVQ